MFQHLGETALRLVEQYGYLAVALFTFLEASMLFPLLPSEVVVPGAAALLVGGPVTFALFVAAVVVGTTVGSLFAYHVFGERGRSALASHGGWLRVSEDRLERATAWFRRWGEHSVLWGRLLPILRSLVSVPAGLSGMARWKFTLYSAVGSLAFAVVVATAVETGLNLIGIA
ncbi:VTT domain-containing protein [Halorussus gelatinilyticus]|uniref:VTT domain-containing protein n=1 Tax=Halorussus gelatinilyticus TaxID=2937524 RepID=A0A8U0ILC7_9EURY|nr:VTT domain-containing protein [Halorussus gelatinilyticus]UPW01142.1 VTT domain-containing protein [Halorussus gelatinilyticus]